MADLTPAERLQPCLLDRLTDEEPDRTQESRERRVLSMQQYRGAVLRDLAWLFNTSRHVPGEGFEEFEAAKSSVVNFGIRDVTGLSVSSFAPGELERAITQAIVNFEPRILRDSLRVKVITDESQMSRTAVYFEITGQLWAQPLPESLFIRTELDLETGQFEVRGSS